MMRTALILTGTGNPGRAAANIYASGFADRGVRVHFVENRMNFKFIWLFFRRRIRRFGLINTLGTFFLRVTIRQDPVEPVFKPELSLTDLDDLDDAFLDKIRPDIVISNACSLLSPELIGRLHAKGCQIINVHNGINPRYRGTGNVWAFLERNFVLSGVTLHHLDAGIDTGKIIDIKFIDFIAQGVPFEQTDIVALEAGARMAIDYVLHHETHREPDTPDPELRSRVYTYPSYSEYHTARARYLSALAQSLPLRDENTFQTSLGEQDATTEESSFGSRHRWDAGTTIGRDVKIREILDRNLRAGAVLADIGCGDGRYRDFWPEVAYWGCDFSLETMAMGGNLKQLDEAPDDICKSGTQVLADATGNCFVETSAADLPFRDKTVDTILAIGLLQHIDNTGALADEFLRILAREGRIVLNTLRQPSFLELVPVMIFGVFNAQYRELGQAIRAQDYFSGRIISGTKLARRYSLREIAALFAPQAKVIEVHYTGLFGTRLMSREITVFLKKPV